MNRNAMILTLALAVIALLMPLAISDDSTADATDTSEDQSAIEIDSNVWFCYGRNITIRDHNYDASTYSHIEWRYSLIRAELDTIAPVQEVVLQFKVPFEVCADDSMVTYYVRETAIVGGQEKSEDLEVIINPSSYIRYVQFMYNDGTDTVYLHAPVTSERCYKYGVEYLVDPPSKSPIWPGHKFLGWYEDYACTKPYGKATYKIFDDSRIARIYAKWDVDPSSYPGWEMVKITLEPVEGLKFDYDGLVIRKGTDFRYDVSIMKKYDYNLNSAGSKCITDGRDLEKVNTGMDGSKVTSCSFTLKNVEIDSVIVLTGAVRLFYIYEECHDVRIATGYQNPTSGSLNLKLELIPGTVYNGMKVSVWMDGKDVTGNVVDGNRISIDTITGDVYIFAHGTYVEKQDFPWWIVAAAAAAILAILAAILLLRKKRALVLSSSGSSVNQLPSQDFDGRQLQCIAVKAGEEADPVYVFLRDGKDSYVREGYRFVSEAHPDFIEIREDGTILVDTSIATASRGTFTVSVCEESSDKVVCSGEFGYSVS